MKLWGLRTKNFSCHVDKEEVAKRTVEKDLEKKNEEFSLTRFFSELFTILCKTYFAILLIFVVWNGVLAEKISGFKPLNITDAIALLLFVNLLRTPKKPITDTISRLFR